jgi:hypothetical protein
MDSMLHEPISVDAIFDAKNPHRCTPKSFKRTSGREISITEIGLIHPKFDGIKTHFMFDLTDGEADYRLSFDTEQLEWFLEWEGDRNV